MIASVIHLVLALVTSITGASDGWAETGKRFALLIGNSRYEVATPLRNPENDVDLLSKSLKAAGFETFVGLNARHADMERLVEAMLSEAKAAAAPVVLVFFAGHGVQVAGKNYLIGIDAKIGSAEDVASASLDANALLARIAAVSPSLGMLVLDACRNDPFENRTRNLAAGLAPMTATGDEPRFKNRLIAYSTSPGKVAFDGNTGTSPYASAFAEAVLVPGLKVEDAFKRIRQKVIERTQGKQEPWETSALYEDFRFMSEAAAARLSPEEETIWDLASMVSSAEGYQRYLDKYPSGMFATLARDKIAALNKDFSYTRKAELFPIVQYAFEDFPRCTAEPDQDFPFKLRDAFTAVDGQIVYVDLTIPDRFLYCSYDGTRRPNYDRLQTVGKATGDCTMRQMGNPPDFKTVEVPCLKPADAPFASEVDAERLFRQGGSIISLQGMYVRLAFPEGSDPHYRTTYEAAEGSVHEAWSAVRGLVRVKVFKEEAFYTIYLEPADARDLGLTWKLDNTVGKATATREARAREIAEPGPGELVPDQEPSTAPEPAKSAAAEADEPPATKPVPQPAARAPKPALGWSFNYPKRDGAIKQALAGCPGNCRIAIWFSNSCGAIAIGASGGWGSASHAKQKFAMSKALKSCRTVDTKCVVERWVCSGRFGAIAVEKR
jgi:hypothetical protein